MSIENYPKEVLNSLFEEHLGIPTDRLETKEDYVETYEYAQEMAREQKAQDRKIFVTARPVVDSRGRYHGEIRVRGIKNFS